MFPGGFRYYYYVVKSRNLVIILTENMQILICDNNVPFAEALKRDVLAVFPGNCTVTICHSPTELREICANTQPDIMLMDILLGEYSGIDLAKELFPRGSGTSVIFVTGYLEYCTDVYEADHVYFLPKPIQAETLRRALEKAVAAQEELPVSVVLRTGGSLQRVAIRDIYSVESFYRKLRVRLRSSTLECYGSMKTLPEAALKRLIHCHKSFLVNPEHVRTMDRQSFLLTNGVVVPISRTRYAESRKAFLDYCGQHLEAD